MRETPCGVPKRDIGLPASVAQGIFDGVGQGVEDIFPDPMSAALAPGWQAGPAKALERQNAALLEAQPVAS